MGSRTHSPRREARERLASAPATEAPPVPATRWANITRTIYTRAQYETHAQHVLLEVWRLEDCEYCRCEYHLEVTPLGAD
jgi:hypothetical protein